jgi:type II secretory pathway component PulK
MNWRRPSNATATASRERGSVLIIVLWVAFGLVTLALYFANSMSFELRASDNRVAAIEASQAIAGALRYASNLLATAVEEPGLPLDDLEYQTDALPVGDATVWFLGRDPRQTLPDEPWFGLADEGAKLNLNTATFEMLELLPDMTAEFAAAIVDWRDSDSEVTSGGAEDETYLRLNPAYRCKNAPFESAEELRLVSGADLRFLYGEDTNLNGVLDPNENDGDVTPPDDDRDGQLDGGLLEYVTVYTADRPLRSDGTARLNVNSTNQQELATLFEENFGTDRANAILQKVGGQPGGGGPGGGGPGGGAGGGTNGTTTTFSSLLHFYIQTGMTLDEFAQVEGDLTVSTNTPAPPLVNVNTASEAVLACIPGIGQDNAPALVAYRQSNSSTVTTVAWVAEVLEDEAAIQAGPYLTGRSYQYAADLAALGHHGRGYQRVRFILDTTGTAPRVVARQDLTHLGWALGREVRERIETARRDGLALGSGGRGSGFWTR